MCRRCTNNNASCAQCHPSFSLDAHNHTSPISAQHQGSTALSHAGSRTSSATKLCLYTHTECMPHTTAQRASAEQFLSSQKHCKGLRCACSSGCRCNVAGAATPYAPLSSANTPICMLLDGQVSSTLSLKHSCKGRCGEGGEEGGCGAAGETDGGGRHGWRRGGAQRRGASRGEGKG